MSFLPSFLPSFMSQQNSLAELQNELLKAQRLAQVQIWQGSQVAVPMLSPYIYAAPQGVTLKEFKNSVKELESVGAEKVLAEVPDKLLHIISWRAWSVKCGRLRGIGYDTEWKPGVENESSCSAMHSSPFEGCQCGFWGFKTRDALLDALENYDKSSICIGEVYQWGQYIECKNGFRSQFAYPKELWLFNRGHRELGRTYNVPVRCK